MVSLYEQWHRYLTIHLGDLKLAASFKGEQAAIAEGRLVMLEDFFQRYIEEDCQVVDLESATDVIKIAVDIVSHRSLDGLKAESLPKLLMRLKSWMIAASDSVSGDAPRSRDSSPSSSDPGDP